MSVRALLDAAREGDLTGLTGAVYCAVQHKHGIPYATGLWARIVGANDPGHSTPGRGGGGGNQRTPKIKVRFYEFEAQARAGKGTLMGPKEVDVTLAMIEKTVPPATDVVSPEGGDSADGRVVTRGRGLGAARPADGEGEEEEEEDGDDDTPPLVDAVDDNSDVEVAPRAAARTPSKTKAKAAARKAASKADEQALIAVLKDIGFNVSSIDGLINKAGYGSVKEVQALRGLGETEAQLLAVQAELEAPQRMLLKSYMKTPAVPPPNSLLNQLHESEDEDEDDEDNEDAEGRAPAPAKGGNPTPTPKAGGRALVTALVGKVPATRREEVMGEALELVCDALHGRLPTAVQRKHVEVALEASLRALGASVKDLTPASPRSVESVMEAVMGLTMGYSPDQKAAGRGGARGAMPVDVEEGDEDAAGWIQGGGKQDLPMQQALHALKGDTETQAMVQKMLGMEDARMVQALSVMGADSNVAVLAYKGEPELKPPAGARHSPAIGELVHGMGAVREKVAEYIARVVLRPLLPTGGSDELALAGKLARGRLDQLDWSSVFGAGAVKSSMGSLGGAKAAPRSGATADILLVTVRAMGVLAAGYGAAHPFDTTVVQTVVGLQTEILKAVQRGVEVKTATDAVLDPFLYAMARRWDAVARRAGMRPVMAEGRAELEHNEKELREAPASPKAPAAEVGAEAARLKKENAALKEKVTGLEKKAAGEYVGKREKWESQNPGKCFFWTELQKCNQGKHCRNASQPGHVQ